MFLVYIIYIYIYEHELYIQAYNRSNLFHPLTNHFGKGPDQPFLSWWAVVTVVESTSKWVWKYHKSHHLWFYPSYIRMAAGIRQKRQFQTHPDSDGVCYFSTMKNSMKSRKFWWLKPLWFHINPNKIPIFSVNPAWWSPEISQPFSWRETLRREHPHFMCTG